MKQWGGAQKEFLCHNVLFWSAPLSLFDPPSILHFFLSLQYLNSYPSRECKPCCLWFVFCTFCLQHTLPVHLLTFFMWWMSKYRLFSNSKISGKKIWARRRWIGFFGMRFKDSSFTSKVIFCYLNEFINSLKRNYFMISTKEPWACLKSVLLPRRDLYYFLSCDQHKYEANVKLC